MTKIKQNQKDSILRESGVTVYLEEVGSSGGRSRDRGSSLAWPSLWIEPVNPSAHMLLFCHPQGSHGSLIRSPIRQLHAGRHQLRGC